MVSNAKKYKNQIARCKKEISKYLKMDREFTGVRYRVNILFDGFELGLQYIVRVSNDIKVVCEGNKIYFGLDMSKGTLDYGFDSGALSEVIYGLCFPRHSWYESNDKLHAKISPYLTVDSGDAPKSDVLREIESSEVYYEILNSMDDIRVSSNVVGKLNDGEWPKLKDRSILPLMIWDLQTCEADVYDTFKWKKATSYRKNREKDALFRVLAGEARLGCNNAARSIEYVIGLSTFTISHSDVTSSYPY